MQSLRGTLDFHFAAAQKSKNSIFLFASTEEHHIKWDDVIVCGMRKEKQQYFIAFQSALYFSSFLHTPQVSFKIP